MDSVVGYSGSVSRETNPRYGNAFNPTYEDVQDYAESIRFTFNAKKLTYEQVLDLFFDFHTPADPKWAGTQYRSAIFVYTPEQRSLAERACKKRGTIGTFVKIEDASDFYRAEEYHQKYVEKQTRW